MPVGNFSHKHPTEGLPKCKHRPVIFQVSDRQAWPRTNERKTSDRIALPVLPSSDLCHLPPPPQAETEEESGTTNGGFRASGIDLTCRVTLIEVAKAE